MSDHLDKFDVLAPANTPVSGSITTAVTFPPGSIEGIKVKIPGGHSRLTGLRIYYGNAQVIPRSVNKWVRGNKVSYDFPFTDPQPGGAGWFTEVFNTGKYAHTFELYLQVDDLTVADTADLPPVILLPLIGEPASAGVASGAGGVPSPSGGGIPRE